jgi:DNA-binding response OmpR family regulator
MEKILVISDDTALQRGLRHSFESAGFSVESADEPRAALEKFRSAKPRVAVLDLCMTGSVGRDLCRRLKQEAPGSAIIALSASSDIQDKVLMLESGAEDYMTKPFSPRELLARVRAVLRRLDHGVQASTHSPVATRR